MNTKPMRISKIITTVALTGAMYLATGFVATADAAQGCGWGFHRNPWGGCVRNYHRVWVNPGPAHCWRGPYGRLHCR
jgi:hypothetical protein